MRFLILLSLLFFTSCSKRQDAPEIQTVRVAIDEEPDSLDPRKARSLKSFILLDMLFEGLSRSSLNGSVELGLAKSMSVSEDGLTYTFTLRDAYWSNGDQITSSDFMRSWKTMLDPHFATDAAYHLYVVKGAKNAKSGKIPLDQVGLFTPDSSTLVVELESPISHFLELLTMPPFFPTHQKSPEIYCGPFLLKEWSHSDAITLAKNPAYWNAKKVCLDQIELIIVHNETGLQMFEKGSLDWIGSPLSVIPPEAIFALKEANQLQTSPFAATYFYRINTDEEIEGKPNPLARKELRQFLAASIDRALITTHILQGGHTPAYTLVPKEMGLEEIPLLEKPVLNEEWMPKEPLVISYIHSDRNAAIAQAIQKEWERAGIPLDLEAVESKIYFQRVSQKKYQIAAGSWTADFEDPINFLEVFKYKATSTNNTGWERSEYIDLLNRSQLCKSSEERRHILSEAQKILMEDMPIIPIFHFAQNYLKREGLKQALLSPSGRLDLKCAYWERP